MEKGNDPPSKFGKDLNLFLIAIFLFSTELGMIFLICIYLSSYGIIILTLLAFLSVLVIITFLLESQYVRCVELISCC